MNSGSIRRSARFRDSGLYRLAIGDLDIAGGQPVGPALEGVLLTTAADGETHYQLTSSHREVVPQVLHDPAISIALTTTRPTFGGTRYWFVCPRRRCGRRCSVLYREPRTNVRAFRCRTCLQFQYDTRVAGRSDAILLRLGRRLIRVAPLSSDGAVVRPRYMHQETFDRLNAEIQQLAAAFKATNPVLRCLTTAADQIEREIQRYRSASCISTAPADLSASSPHARSSAPHPRAHPHQQNRPTRL
jgi:hypothetical protein